MNNNQVKKRLLNGGSFFGKSTEGVGVPDAPNGSAVYTSAPVDAAPIQTGPITVTIKATSTPEKKLILNNLVFDDKPGIRLYFKPTGLEPAEGTSEEESVYAKSRVSGLSVDNGMPTRLQKISSVATSASTTAKGAAKGAFSSLTNYFKPKTVQQGEQQGEPQGESIENKPKIDGGTRRRRRNKKTVSRRRRASRRR